MIHWLATVLRTFGACALVFAIAGPAYSGPIDQARTLNHEGRHTEALEIVQELLKRDPQHVDAQILKGLTLIHLKRITDGIEQFERLVREHPELPIPWNNLGVLYANQHRYQEAEASILKAIELAPNYGIARMNLGDVYANLTALTYQKAYELDPQNDRARIKAKRFKNALASKRVAGSSEATAITTPEPPAEPPPTAIADCFMIEGSNGDDELAPMRRWFESQGIRTRNETQTESVFIHHRVYLAPFPTPEAANEAIAALQASGIIDVVRIAYGDLKNGVALGAYRRAASADRRVARLRGLGYAAQSAPRHRNRVVTRLVVEYADTTDAIATGVSEFARQFPGHSPIPVPCH